MMTRSAIVRADEPKIASRAALLLLEELLRDLELRGLNPKNFRAEVSKKAGRDVRAVNRAIIDNQSPATLRDSASRTVNEHRHDEQCSEQEAGVASPFRGRPSPR